MKISNKKKFQRIFKKSLKIGLGSGLAIIIAHFLNLKYEMVAGTITLLTILTTRWETIRLSLYRIVTFVGTVLTCYLVHNLLGDGWLQYGVFLLIMVFCCEMFGLAGTISVNAVIGAHFFTESDFSPDFIINEFILLLIGISIAITLSLATNNRASKKEVIGHMEYVEEKLKGIFMHLSGYLRNEPLEHSVWDDISHLENKLKEFIQDACEYNDNSFSSDPQYYIGYFEMRLLQMDELHNLHYEMRRMRSMPAQAEVVANFVDFISSTVGQMNALDLQFEKLREILEHLKQEKLPQTQEELESMAVLYHVLMNIEDYLIIKQRFVNELDEKHRNETFIKD